jgi:nucleoid-associated protein YgaU
MAAGQQQEAPARDVLADVLNVFGADPGLHWGVLAERLARAFPDRWDGATGDSVSAECRAAGIPSVTVKVAGLTLRGCRLEDIRRAAA